MDHTTPEIRANFVKAHELWAAGKFTAFMDLMHEDITYIVNVDGQQVPYAMSAVGREDLRDRLQLLLDTFDVTQFKILEIYPASDGITSLVHGIYRHKATTEILDIRVRFCARYDAAGKIAQMEEIHDARYIEAFERFVFFIANAASGR